MNTLGQSRFLLLAVCASISILATCKKPEPVTDLATPKLTPVRTQSLDSGSGAEHRRVDAGEVVALGDILNDLTAIITNRSLFPLSEADADARLRSLGPLRREESAPDPAYPGLTISGERRPFMRFQIEYVLDENHRWKFSAASFDVTDPSGDARSVYKRLHKSIRQRLGKPLWTKPEQGKLASVAWRLKGQMELCLGEGLGDARGGASASGQVEINISEPAGEPD